MADIKFINEIIKRKYGYDMLNNPCFRVVWSENQTEVRHGEFEKWYGQIYLGKEITTKRVKKYDYISEKWILERLFANNEKVTGIIGNITYEPIFVFQKHGEYLEPNLRAVDFLCYSSMNPTKNYTNWDDKSRDDFEKEVQFMEDYLDTSFMQTQLRGGEAVSFAGVKNGPS